MTPLFYYEHSQRKSAFMLLVNTTVFVIAWLAINMFLPKSIEGAEELIYWVNIFAPIIGLCLVILALIFYIKNKKFYISLTIEQLEVFDPLFSNFSWAAPLEEIKHIEHSMDKQAMIPVIKLKLLNGTTLQLTSNYKYNRTTLYKEISKAAPHIIMPKNPNMF